MSCTLKILSNLILKRNTERVYYINRTQVTTNDPLKLEWELSGVLFLFLHTAGKFRGFFFCSCTLQEGFGGSFFVPAHCREVSGVFFLFLHTAGSFRGYFFYSCTLQEGFGDTFFISEYCREVSGVLFLFLHIAGSFRRFFLLNLSHF